MTTIPGEHIKRLQARLRECKDRSVNEVVNFMFQYVDYGSWGDAKTWNIIDAVERFVEALERMDRVLEAPDWLNRGVCSSRENPVEPRKPSAGSTKIADSRARNIPVRMIRGWERGGGR